jgi:hypothetical protein
MQTFQGGIVKIVQRLFSSSPDLHEIVNRNVVRLGRPVIVDLSLAGCCCSPEVQAMSPVSPEEPVEGEFEQPCATSCQQGELLP